MTTYTMDPILQSDIRQWVEKHGNCRSAIIPILHEVHRKYSWVSEDAMQEIADHLGIHPVEVYGVATFYSFFNTEPKGRKVIRLCQTVSCDMSGKAGIAQALEQKLGIRFGETTPDGEYTLEWTNCMGWCDQGPALFVNTKPFTRVTVDRLDEILKYKEVENV